MTLFSCGESYCSSVDYTFHQDLLISKSDCDFVYSVVMLSHVDYQN